MKTILSVTKEKKNKGKKKKSTRQMSITKEEKMKGKNKKPTIGDLNVNFMSIFGSSCH